MSTHRDDGPNTLLSRNFQPSLGEGSDAISSLNQAWSRVLGQCVIEHPIDDAMRSLMRNCFFGGAMLAVLLLQKGRDDQLAAEFDSFTREDPGSFG
jgi:hypothetical protein